MWKCLCQVSDIQRESCCSTSHSRHLTWAGWITLRWLLAIFGGCGVNLCTSLGSCTSRLGDSWFMKVIWFWFWKGKSTGNKVRLADSAKCHLSYLDCEYLIPYPGKVWNSLTWCWFLSWNFTVVIKMPVSSLLCAFRLIYGAKVFVSNGPKFSDRYLHQIFANFSVVWMFSFISLWTRRKAKSQSRLLWSFRVAFPASLLWSHRFCGFKD